MNIKVESPSDVASADVRAAAIARDVELAALEYARQGFEMSAGAQGAARDHAVKWINAVLDRRPMLTSDDLVAAVELYNLVAQYVTDPHDWDSVGTVAALLDYRPRWCQLLGSADQKGRTP